ncbi:MAG: hypothetical protein EG826_02230 [Deltaproteobacteria bacterium]|nr:hypothetical protein [Deltaproteobacteria bacterium]
MPDRLRILITNNTLAGRAGSELYVRDLALALMKRGHYPVAYSTVLGDVAEELRRATVPVIDNLAYLGRAPDIIHGQHHLDAMTAMMYFPKTPAVFVCHGWLPWEEWPPVFPSIRRYIAVDDLCRERLLTTEGILERDIEIIYNFVDTERFQQRPPLPEKPRSALIFSNYAGDNRTTDALRAACARAGVGKVDVAGAGSGNIVDHPERILAGYDVVFAKGRCALEAMAVGCAVIIADFSGLGGMVTTDNVASLRKLNFGVRTMQSSKVNEESVFRELQKYSANDAKQVSDWIRNEGNMSTAIDKWLRVYEHVLVDWVALPEESVNQMANAQLPASSKYLRSLATMVKDRYELAYRYQQVNQERQMLESSWDEIRRSRAWKMIAGYRKFRAWLHRL